MLIFETYKKKKELFYFAQIKKVRTADGHPHLIPHMGTVPL